MNLTRVFNKTNFKKPAFLISLSLFLLLGLVPLTASASFGSWLGQNLILPLAEFIGGLTVSLIGILIGIVQYNDFINAPAVAKGWVVVRDVANMFVIVVMLVIAFATVFRIEEYQYKKLLSKLLIMSVLVNFSKMLTGFFIDFAQVIMLTFVNGFKEAAAGNFVNGFHLSEMFEFSKNKNSIDGTGVSENSFFVASVLALISITVAMVVVAIYLVVFLVRIAFLWLLTIISPLAFLLSAFPGQAKKYSSEWWEYFGKYLSTGPILAFFLWLALAMMQTSNDVLGSFSGQEGSYGLSEIPAAAVTGIGQSDILLSFIVNIVILLGGLWMTQKLGVVGGKLAGSALAKMQSIGSSIVKSPFKAAGAVGGFAAGRAWGSIKYGWNEWTSKIMEAHEGHKVGVGRKILYAALNPIAAARGWEARTEELEHEAKEIAQSYGREITEQFRTGGKLNIPYSTFVERKHENEYMKEYQNMSKEEFMRSAVGAESLGGEEGKRRRRAIVKAAASQGYLDDFMRIAHFANKYGKTDGTVYDDEVLNNFLFSYLGKDNQSLRLMDTDLEQLGKATNHWEYLGHAYYDPSTGTYKRGYTTAGKDKKGNDILKNTHQADYARQEIQKIGGRARVQDAPHNEVAIKAEMNADGTFKIDAEGDNAGQVAGVHWGYGENGPTALHKAIMSATSDASSMRDIHFAQGRLKEAMLSNVVDQAAGEIVISREKDLEKIKTLYEEIPQKILAFYGQLTGNQNAKGFVVRLQKADGTVERYKIGDVQHSVLAGNETASDLRSEYKDDIVSDLAEKDVAKIASKYMQGGILPSEDKNLQEEIYEHFRKTDFYKQTEASIKASKIKDASAELARNNPEWKSEQIAKEAEQEVKSIVAQEVKKKFDKFIPAIFEVLGKKRAEFFDVRDYGFIREKNFSPGVINELNKSIKDSLGDSFSKIHNNYKDKKGEIPAKHVDEMIEDLKKVVLAIKIEGVKNENSYDFKLLDGKEVKITQEEIAALAKSFITPTSQPIDLEKIDLQELSKRTNIINQPKDLPIT